LTPGSGMGKKFGSGMNNPDHIWAWKQFLGLKYLKFLMRIRDPGWKKFESGIGDKHSGSATLCFLQRFRFEKSGPGSRWANVAHKNWGRIQRKTWCMGPYAGVDLAICRLQHMYHGQPYATRVDLNLLPESTLFPRAGSISVRKPFAEPWNKKCAAFYIHDFFSLLYNFGN
jgi:hypothetical protein